MIFTMAHKRESQSKRKVYTYATIYCGNLRLKKLKPFLLRTIMARLAISPNYSSLERVHFRMQISFMATRCVSPSGACSSLDECDLLFALCRMQWTLILQNWARENTLRYFLEDCAKACNTILALSPSVDLRDLNSVRCACLTLFHLP
jgi:hypothetical protein